MKMSEIRKPEWMRIKNQKTRGIIGTIIVIPGVPAILIMSLYVIGIFFAFAIHGSYGILTGGSWESVLATIADIWYGEIVIAGFLFSFLTGCIIAVKPHVCRFLRSVLLAIYKKAGTPFGNFLLNNVSSAKT